MQRNNIQSSLHDQGLIQTILEGTKRFWAALGMLGQKLKFEFYCKTFLVYSKLCSKNVLQPIWVILDVLFMTFTGNFC